MIVKSFEVKKIIPTDKKFFLIYGKNRGLKKDIINDIFVKNFDGDVSKFDESQIINNKDNFISELLNKSLFGINKVIIIKATNKIFDVILYILEKEISDVKIIIDCEELDKKSKLRSIFEKDKNLIIIPVYEDNFANLSSIIRKFIDDKKIKLSQEIINLLIERAQGDRENLKNELTKIEYLLHTKKSLDIEDITKLTNLSGNYTVFELVESFLSKNKKKISKILNENNFNDEDCILILRTILNRSKRLLDLKHSSENLRSINEAISSYKPPIFWKEKDIVKKQIETWSLEEIKKIMYKTSNLEILVKKNSSNSINFVYDFVNN